MMKVEAKHDMLALMHRMIWAALRLVLMTIKKQLEYELRKIRLLFRDIDIIYGLSFGIEKHSWLFSTGAGAKIKIEEVTNTF